MSDRDRAIAEYGEECNVCGATENIEVHHIDGDRSNHSVENLVPLCEEHHQAVHNGEEAVADLAEDLPDETGRRKARASVSLDQDTYQYLQRRADKHDTSFSGAVRDVVEEVRTESGPTAEERAKEERIEMLEEQVEFLRSVVREAVSNDE